MREPSRRGLLLGAASAALAGCDRIAQKDSTRRALAGAERVTAATQRVLSPASALAHEYVETDISPSFKANGTTAPDDEGYQALAAKGFADWRLEVGGLVERPTQLSLDDIRALPSRTQITRHDCVEGWSCIGKWKGAPLAQVLQRVGLKPEARYLMFYCADPMNGADAESKYYESLDIAEASHPQTLLAYEMNDKPLPVAHGAPLRLRVERQLGYKMAKYLLRIEAVTSFADLRDGKGGYWEDLGYAWYAGI